MKILFSAKVKEAKGPSFRKQLKACKTKEEKTALKKIRKENKARENRQA